MFIRNTSLPLKKAGNPLQGNHIGTGTFSYTEKKYEKLALYICWILGLQTHTHTKKKTHAMWVAFPLGNTT